MSSSRDRLLCLILWLGVSAEWIFCFVWRVCSAAVAVLGGGAISVCGVGATSVTITLFSAVGRTTLAIFVLGTALCAWIVAAFLTLIIAPVVEVPHSGQLSLF